MLHILQNWSPCRYSWILISGTSLSQNIWYVEKRNFPCTSNKFICIFHVYLRLYFQNNWYVEISSTEISLTFYFWLLSAVEPSLIWMSVLHSVTPFLEKAMNRDWGGSRYTGSVCSGKGISLSRATRSIPCVILLFWNRFTLAIGGGGYIFIL